MIRLLNADRSRLNRRSLRPTVENLEGRQLLYAATTNHFTSTYNITFSIMPDGTNIGGKSSNLVSTLNNTYGAGKWQGAIQDAFAGWEQYANLNFTMVSDNGASVGSGTLQQGSPNFGDIRIGGYAQPSGTLAYTLSPPPANGDSGSGDVFINTAAAIGGPGGYDLETIVLHEVGHALGLGHSTDTTASMYAYYQGTKDDLVQDDINGIQALYGPRVNDYYTQNYYNTTLSSAVDISSQLNQYMMIGIGYLNVTNTNTPYFFKVTTASNASNQFAAIVQSTGWSLLSPQVQIFSSTGKLLAQNMGSPFNYGSTMGIQINNATPNTTYIVRVLGDSNAPNNTGAYGLLINESGGGPGPVYPPPVRQVSVAASQGGGGSSLATVTSKHAADLDLPDFTQVGTLHSSGDYLVVAPVAERHTSKATVRVAVSHPTRSAQSRRIPTAKPEFA